MQSIVPESWCWGDSYQRRENSMGWWWRRHLPRKLGVEGRVNAPSSDPEDLTKTLRCPLPDSSAIQRPSQLDFCLSVGRLRSSFILGNFRDLPGP